jgi:hypothetical protein
LSRNWVLSTGLGNDLCFSQICHQQQAIAPMVLGEELIDEFALGEKKAAS